MTDQKATREKEVVWDFANPYYEEGSVGFVCRCLRYSPDYVRPALARSKRD